MVFPHESLKPDRKSDQRVARYGLGSDGVRQLGLGHLFRLLLDRASQNHTGDDVSPSHLEHGRRQTARPDQLASTIFPPLEAGGFDGGALEAAAKPGDVGIMAPAIAARVPLTHSRRVIGSICDPP
jgi:hypothetical protein